MTIEAIKGDGTNGYEAGTWEYRIRIGEMMWVDGGYPDRNCAIDAAKLRAKNPTSSRRPSPSAARCSRAP